MPEQAEVGGAAFRDRVGARLAAERGETQRPAAPPTPDRDPPAEPRTPQSGAETDELGREGDHALDDDYEDDDDLDPDDPDLDDEIPGDELDDEDDPETVDWEKRYKDLQADHTRLQQAQSNIDSERAEESSQFLSMGFELEDSIRAVRQQAEFLRNAMTGNAQRFQSINWAQVPADQVQAVQQQAQQAFAMAQKAEEAYQHHVQQAEQAEAGLRQRQARIAHARLVRTIPGWREDHRTVLKDLREFATSSGMQADTFSQIVDPVIVEWAHAAMQMKQGTQTVNRERRNRNKQRPPRSSTGQQPQPRSADGKFRRANKDFQQNPSRATFRAKQEAKLRREGR